MHPPGVFAPREREGVFSRMFLTILTKPATTSGNRCPLLVLDPYRNQCSA